jgi:alkylhydroperoxidase family enzyme
MSQDRPDGEASEPAWIALLDPEEADGELAEAYRTIGARSRVAHIIGVHSLHPAAMEAHVELYRTLMFGPSPLSRLEREALAVVVSAANDCFY